MIESILEDFNLRPDCKTIDCGNAGGFSGSSIWKVTSPLRGDFCLKQWPKQFQDSSRMQWIHKVLAFAHANGCPEIVQPEMTCDSNSYIYRDDTFWELFPWATGNRLEPAELNSKQLESAIEVLARFHQATARFFFNFTPSSQITKVSDQLSSVQLAVKQIEKSPAPRPFMSDEQWTTFKLAAPPLALKIAKQLLPHSSVAFPVQPVIKDIRPEHLFIHGDSVSSIIDFGAMNVDSIACDLARLLGECVGDSPVKIDTAIDIYSQYRQVYPHERNIVFPLNQASVILGILNWLKWLLVDQRKFDSLEGVTNRLSHLFRRFESYL